MYTKLMVTLDGSPLAEKALPYAVRLANRFNATLLLLRATEVPALLNDTPEHELEVIKEAENYLQEVRATITDSAVEPHLDPEHVQTLVAYGDSVRELSELAPFEKADLIVMTTHGRTGLSRLLMGSVATQVVQHSNLPVVLIRPEKVKDEPLTETMAEPVDLHLDENNTRVVVTLDGTPEAEAVIEPATQLALSMGASVYLISVALPYVPMEYGDLSASYAFDPEQETQARREEAYAYLDKIQDQITAKGLNCVKVVRVGNPAEEITDYAQKVQASLLVMATHARRRVGQVLLGSVAEDVMRESHLPVMMVHTFPHSKAHQEKEESLTTAK